MWAIETRDLTKRFGEVVAVDTLNLRVPKGSVFGFLGPNGAGKTTTIRLLTGLAKPSGGDAHILGFDVISQKNAVYYQIGYLPEVPAFYPWMTAQEYLVFAGELYGLKGADLKERADSLLKLADLEGIKKTISTFSRGMKQRLGIVQALVNDPELLFLDEPTSALDPLGRKEILEMIASLAQEKTVFFSTHILADVERVCDTVAILDKGRLILHSDLDTLKSQYLQPIFTLEFAADPEVLANELKKVPWVLSVEKAGREIKVKAKEAQAAQIDLPRYIAQSKLPLRSFQVAQPTLEDIFVEVLSHYE